MAIAEPEAVEQAQQAPPKQVETVVVELPLGEIGEKEFLSRHIESRLKTLAQKITMKRLLRGLQQTGATTKDGRPVQRLGEAIRWLLEQIA